MGWLRVRLVWATRHVLIRILTVFAVIRLWLFVRFFGECDLAAYPPPPSRRRRRRAAGKEKVTQQQQQQQQPGCIPSCLGDEGMDVVGHRGASARAPENTLASFRLALADGFRGVELDVHMSRDGRVFVLHDSTLRRVCDPSYRAKLSSRSGGGGGGGNVLDTPVRLLDWGVISRVPVGLHRGQPCYPPLLSDVLTLLAQEPCPPPQSDHLTNCFQPRVRFPKRCCLCLVAEGRWDALTRALWCLAWSRLRGRPSPSQFCPTSRRVTTCLLLCVWTHRRLQVVLIEFKECDNEICERVAGIVRRFLRQQCAEKPSSSSVLASDRAKLRFKKKREEEEEQEGPATSRTLLDIRFISFRLACLSRMKVGGCFASLRLASATKKLQTTAN